MEQTPGDRVIPEQKCPSTGSFTIAEDGRQQFKATPREQTLRVGLHSARAVTASWILASQLKFISLTNTGDKVARNTNQKLKGVFLSSKQGDSGPVSQQGKWGERTKQSLGLYME